MIHSLQVLLFAAFGTALLSGCNENSAEKLDEEGLGGAQSTLPNSPLSLSDADLLFDAPNVPIFDLTLPPETWATMQKEALEEEYAEANLSFEGEDLGAVGLRFKGSWGSLSLCLDEEGNILCPKLGMKIKFSDVDEDKRFFGLKRLNFHGMVQDESKMVEKVGYKLYRDMGVAAPRTSWAVIKINGESLGIFSMVEQIDGTFTDHRWPDDGDGNLYKETWPVTSNEEWYDRGLTTNEETADHTQIVSFHEEMAAADEDQRLDTLKRWTDPEQLWTYMAVDDAISNWDGATAWYDWGDVYASHNLYWYQHEMSDTFTLIPWDLDGTLMPYIPTGEVPHWTMTPNDCNQTYTIWGNVEVKAPGCDPIFHALASDRRHYEDAADRLLNGPFNLDVLNAQIDEYAEMIGDAVEEDPTGYGRGSWEVAVGAMKEHLALHRLKFEALRAGRELQTSTLSISGINDFEAAEPYSVILGIQVYKNPRFPTGTNRVSRGGSGAASASKSRRRSSTFVPFKGSVSNFARMVPHAIFGSAWRVTRIPIRTKGLSSAGASKRRTQRLRSKFSFRKRGSPTGPPPTMTIWKTCSRPSTESRFSPRSSKILGSWAMVSSTKGSSKSTISSSSRPNRPPWAESTGPEDVASSFSGSSSSFVETWGASAPRSCGERTRLRMVSTRGEG
jgi:spore coat protein H